MEHRKSSQKSAKGHIVLSHHFIKLLQWIMLNETNLLQKLIDKSLNNIINKHNSTIESTDSLSTQDEEFQKTIIEFLDTIDTMISLSMDEYQTTRIFQRQCMPVIDKIDSTAVEDITVQQSIRKAVLKENNITTSNQMKQLMLQELLKQWKPAKKIVH